MCFFSQLFGTRLAGTDTTRLGSFGNCVNFAEFRGYFLEKGKNTRKMMDEVMKFMATLAYLFIVIAIAFYFWEYRKKSGNSQGTKLERRQSRRER